MMEVLRMRYTLCFFNDTATTEIYTLSLHDALPILAGRRCPRRRRPRGALTARTRRARRAPSFARGGAGMARTASPPARGARSEEHTSELQSRQYLVCRLLLEKKIK